MLKKWVINGKEIGGNSGIDIKLFTLQPIQLVLGDLEPKKRNLGGNETAF